MLMLVGQRGFIGVGFVCDTSISDTCHKHSSGVIVYAARSSAALPCVCLSDGVHTSVALLVVLDCGVGYF